MNYQGNIAYVIWKDAVVASGNLHPLIFQDNFRTVYHPEWVRSTGFHRMCSAATACLEKR